MAEITDRHRQIAKQVVTSPPDQEGQIALVALALADAEQRGAESTRGGIRVLRVLEYVYPDVTTMEKDRLRWTVQHSIWAGATRIRSTVLPLEVLNP
jgi:hypothetical protein